ncbi:MULTISPECIES: hypothetical protein [Sphingomonas]|uniref:Uncharacterized protein n=1 Tax=Sphingomonas adhaesiva TaxID=28212 RepID=A0A2A4I357_9SPHN|nr:MULTISPECIES: hypothetical protein [Sphingomonas]PCG13407.1 hypothetical protein COA07_14640 [Sphingomonas adhaesiva]PZU72572.1 MAG: hypothetical protein DI530_18030 [Sphingomonas sp.]
MTYPAHPATMLAEPQRAYASIETPIFGARAGLALTPAGLLAIGGMVTMILAGSAAIVAATRLAPPPPPPPAPDVSARRGSRRSRG